MAFSDNLKGKKGHIFLIGGGVGLVAFLYWKHQQSAASAASAATQSTATGSTVGTGSPGDPFPSDGTTGNPSDPNSVDPATGMTYGDEGQGYGTGYGGYGYGYGQGGGGTSGQPGPGSFTNNAQWTQYALQQMTFSDPVALSTALGLYIAGQPLTTAQVALVDQAIALAGYPPVSGPGGYPPSMKTGGTGGGGSATVPNVVGGNRSAALKAIAAAGLVPVIAPGAWKDPVKSQSPAAGTSVNQGSKVTITGSAK